MRRPEITFIALLAALAVFGCGREGASTARATDAQSDSNAVRIVSLSPAISRTLVDLEMDHLIVGRTPFCDSIDRSIPVVGDLLDLDYERLIRVSPTHMLVQPPAAGINPRLRQLAEERNWSIHAWRLDGLDDVARLIDELPVAVFDRDRRAKLRAAMRAAAILEQIQALTEGVAGSEPHAHRTMLLVGVEPITAFGTGTYLHELLMILGGRNATDQAGYPQFTLEDITRINPGAIILVRPGQASDDRAAFGALTRTRVDAVREGRLFVLTHADSLLPSSGVVGVAEELREILRSFE